MPTLTAFFDANVLYPAPLRDFLMYLALTDIVKVRWSQQIHQEWSQKCAHIPLILVLEEEFQPSITTSDTLGIVQSKNLHDSIVAELQRLKII